MVDGFVPPFVTPEAPGKYFRPEAMRPIGLRSIVWRSRIYWSEELDKLRKDDGPDRTYEVRGD